MKTAITALLVSLCLITAAQPINRIDNNFGNSEKLQLAPDLPIRTAIPDSPVTLRSILLEQLQTTHDQQDWFVPVSKSVEGLTIKQVMWKPSDSSHSIGQLAYHLLFWNKQSLDKFNGKKPDAYSGNNSETFTAFTEQTWKATVQQLDQVLKDWEMAIKQSDEAKLQSWYSTIAHIGTHNAYHTGQIMYIRKLQGSWDSSKGVK